MAHTLTRQELYEMVWAEPKTSLAKKFGVSDVWLSKICRAATVPIPPRGYWAKIAAGKISPRIALPARDLGQTERVRIKPDRYVDQADDESAELPPPPTFSDDIEEVTAKARKLLGRLTVVKSLDSPHHLIAELLDADEQRRREAEGKTYVWDKPIFDEPTARRRLKILNALYLILTRGGFQPTLRGKAAENPGVTVGNFHVSFKLEKVHQGTRFAKTSPGRPKEPLRLEISNRTRSPSFPTSVWQDTKTSALEQQLPEIALSIVVAGEMLYRGDVLWRYKWQVQRRQEKEERIRAEQERISREAEELRLAEIQRCRQGLVNTVESRMLAQNIRNFIADVETMDLTECGDDFLRWRTWATSEANRLDPLCRPLDQMFHGIPTSIV